MEAIEGMPMVTFSERMLLVRIQWSTGRNRYVFVRRRSVKAASQRENSDPERHGVHFECTEGYRERSWLSGVKKGGKNRRLAGETREIRAYAKAIHWMCVGCEDVVGIMEDEQTIRHHGRGRWPDRMQLRGSIIEIRRADGSVTRIVLFGRVGFKYSRDIRSCQAPEMPQKRKEENSTAGNTTRKSSWALFKWKSIFAGEGTAGSSPPSSCS